MCIFYHKLKSYLKSQLRNKIVANFMTVETTKRTCGAPIDSSAPRISAVIRKSTPAERSGRLVARKPFRVYVRILQQNRTLAIELDSSENERALFEKVQQVAGLPKYQLINLSFQGYPMTTAAKLLPNSTILASIRLPGGAFAKVKCSGCDDIILEDSDAEMTLGQLIERFVEENPQKKGQYKLARDEESQEYTTQMQQSLTDLGHIAGGEITVERVVNEEKEKSNSFEGQFLKLIPFVEKSSTIKLIKKELITRQKDLMKGFIERSLSRDELEYILCTLTDDQMDNLLLSLQNKHKDQILRYLLTKAGQWTALSDTLLAKTSEITKSFQIRRLINKLKNTFETEDTTDDLIADLLLQDQAAQLPAIINDMSGVQKIELLMQILDEPGQRKKLVQFLHQGDVRKFWPLLKKNRRMEIFDELEDTTQFAFFTTDRFLEAKQKIILWDNIGRDNRIRIWMLATDPEFTDRFTAQETSDGQFKKNSTEKCQFMLLDTFTVVQQARLWANLNKAQQPQLIRHVVADDKKAVKFWGILNHERRCILIDQIDTDQLLSLFVAMELENRTQLYLMLDDENQRLLQKELSPEQRKELFLYSHFEVTEQTEQNSTNFIKGMVEEHYKQNNQYVPFDKIEAGYVQCISNPMVGDGNGFITVQIVEPQYPVDNNTFAVSEDFTKAELYTDEAQAVNASQKEKNGQFRFTQNVYGQLKESEPNPARNSKKLGIISFYEYSEEKGIWCTHSFFASDPVIFKRNGKTSSQLILFTGLNGEVFFFNKKSKQSSSSEEAFDLSLQIVNRHQDSEKGELSRETSENCFTYHVNSGSQLFDFMTRGRFEMKKYTETFLLNAVPNLIEHQTKNGRCEKYIVFSHCGREKGSDSQGLESGPCLFFYDVNQNKETARVLGGEALIDYRREEDLNGGQARILFLGNKEIMGDQIWGGDNKIKKEYAEKYMSSTDPERKTAIVISHVINLEEDQFDKIVEKNGTLLQWPEHMPSHEDMKKNQTNVPAQLMGQWMPKTHSEENSQVFVIDLKDEDKSFQQRYLRQAPVLITPHHSAQGKTEAFTMLIQHLYAYTFSLITKEGTINDKQRQKCTTQVDEINAKMNKIQAEAKGDVSEQITALDEEKKKVWTDAIPKLFFYKCKYFVPEASEIVFDKKNPDQIKTFVQVSNKNERNQQKARDNLQDENQVELELFNISDTKLKFDAVDKLPTEVRYPKVPMSRNALMMYAKNRYANKFGEMNIRTIAGPILFGKSACVGAFLFNFQDHQVKKLEKSMLEWFIAPVNRGTKQSVVQNLAQTVKVDYPMMAYKGFVPDNRELVLVNLADKESPQKIIHLKDLQFICFVGHSFSDRESRFGMLCLDQGEVSLCWLVACQPFKKRNFNELDHLYIERVVIDFQVPILNDISSIKSVEFVNAKGYTSIADSSQGALVIQTTDELWFSSNATGKYVSVTSSCMSPLSLQRGFNDYFYFCQGMAPGNDTDVTFNEFKLSYVAQEWQYTVQEIHKINEGRVIAMEIDPEGWCKTDSNYTNDNTLVEQNKNALNFIYIIDDKENLWKFRQKGDDESGNRYEVVNEKNLTIGKELTTELNEFKLRKFNRVAITDRCMTLNESNYNFSNGHRWDLEFDRRGHDDIEDEDKLEQALPSEEQNEEQEKIDLLNHQEVNSIESISWTSRMLIQASYKDFVSEQQGYHCSHYFITKLQPGNRRQDLVGLRGLRDMESVNIVSNDLYLMKFRSKELSGIQDYWSLIDKFGQTKRIPGQVKNHLIWSNNSSGASRQKRDGCTVVLRGGQQRILSFDADLTRVEKKMTRIEFNRIGEVTQIKEFKKKIYDDKLRNFIAAELRDNDDIIDGGKSFTQKDLTKITDTLQYQDDVLCTKDGDLYRIASIVDNRFIDDVSINLEKENVNEQLEDKLYMGLFLVKAKKRGNQSSTQLSSKLAVNDKDLKIVLFLCKTEDDRSQLNQSGFTICGQYLCWSYPEERIVHVLNMGGMNKTGTQKATAAFQEGLGSKFSGLFAAASVIQEEREREKEQELTNKKQAEAEKKRKEKIKKQKKKKGMLLDSDDDEDDNDDEDFFNPIKNRKSTTQPLLSGFSLNDSVGITSSKSINGSKGTDDDFTRTETNIAGNALSFMKLATTSTQAQSKKLFDSDGEEIEEQDATNIRWKKYITRVIDLSVMCETDMDMYSMLLQEVPTSTQFSIPKNFVKNALDSEPEVRDNLLQVTIRDRTILFDLSEEEPEEVFFMNACSQFISPPMYVESGLKIVRVQVDVNNQKDFMIEQVITNRCQDTCMLRQDRKQIDYKINDSQKSQIRIPICTGVFKKYAEIDLQELERIQQKVTKQTKLDNIDMQSVLCSYNGHTAFSIFGNDVKFHEQMLQQITEEEFQEEEQEDETLLENNQLRRLFRTLTMPTPDLVDKKESTSAQPAILENSNSLLNDQESQVDSDDEQFQKQASLVETKQLEETESRTKTGLKTVLQKSLYNKSSRIKDCLMSITNVCQDCSLSVFCEDQDDFRTLLSNLTSNAVELIQESQITTPLTRMIRTTVWGPEIQMITMRKNSSIVTQEMIDERIEQELLANGIAKNEFTKAQVEVRLLDLSWLLGNGKNFITFVTCLGEANNDQIYNTNLISTLLAEFWEENYKKILYRCLLPWFSYAICAQFFFVYSLRDDGDTGFWISLLGLITLVLLSWQVYIEVKQNQLSDDWREYFSSLINLSDLFQVSSAFLIVTMNLFHIKFIDNETMCVIAAFSTFCMYVKVLDWFRLFQPTSFFIRLFIETMLDIRYFVIIFFVALMMFGVPMFMLNMNRSVDDENLVVDQVFGNIWFLNAFFNQYMLSLGEFAFDNFEGGSQTYMCYAIFLIATFLTQITFLNMLIALMGDTFSKVIESKEQFGLMTKLDIMGDYSALILDQDEDDASKNFMFIITQKDDGGEDGANWEGNLSVIKKTVEKGLANLQKQLDKRMNAVNAQNLEAKARDAIQEKEQRGQYIRIMEKFVSVDSRFDQIDVEKPEIIYTIVGKTQKEARANIKELRLTNEQLQVDQTRLRHQNEEMIGKITSLSKGATDELLEELRLMKTSQEKLITQQESLKNNHADPGEKHDSAETQQVEAERMQQMTSKLSEVITESSRQSSENITRLAEQQEKMLHEIKSLDQRHESLDSTVSDSRVAQSGFITDQNVITRELQETQTRLMEELRQLKESQTEFQNSLGDQMRQIQENSSQASAAPQGGSNSEEMLTGLQSMMQQLTSSLTEQQSQMQQEILARQEADKQEILTNLQQQMEQQANPVIFRHGDGQ